MEQSYSDVFDSYLRPQRRQRIRQEENNCCDKDGCIGTTKSDLRACLIASCCVSAVALPIIFLVHHQSLQDDPILPDQLFNVTSSTGMAFNNTAASLFKED